MGKTAASYTIQGHLDRDPELRFWRGVVESWEKALEAASKASWLTSTFNNYPGIRRLRAKQEQADAALIQKRSGKHKRKVIGSKVAGRWILVLSYVMETQLMKRLQHGSPEQRATFRGLLALQKWTTVLETGCAWARRTLSRLTALTRSRIFREARVLLCTVDSIPRMRKDMAEGLQSPPTDLAKSSKRPKRPSTLKVDTAILDEAACVLEPAIPVILALKVKNLALVGDHHQLPPYTAVTPGRGLGNHARSLMERAIMSGFPSHFLDIQYRMHPRICKVS